MNIGPARAHQYLQQVFQAYGKGDIQADGVLGPLILAATIGADPNGLMPALRSEAAGFYRWLVGRRGDLAKFLPERLNRAYQ